MGIKDETLHIKINSEEKEAIAKAADQRDISVSQFAREALREKVATVAESRKSESVSLAA